MDENDCRSYQSYQGGNQCVQCLKYINQGEFHIFVNIIALHC